MRSGGKATVYRLFPTKDALIGAYLRRLSASILGLIDKEINRHAEHPERAVDAILAAIAADLARPTFRGCAFNNAGIEFPDLTHPARAAAREYRSELHRRLVALAERVRPAPVRPWARNLPCSSTGCTSMPPTWALKVRPRPAPDLARQILATAP